MGKSNGQGGGAARSAQREDTARLDDDARHARRLAIDRQTQGCVADETNRKGVVPGVSRACPVDSPARLQIIVDRASRVGLTRIFFRCGRCAWGRLTTG